MAEHGAQDADKGLHEPFFAVYNNATDRANHSPVAGPRGPTVAQFRDLEAGDVRKLALQLDDYSAWVLTNHDPVTWERFNTGSVAAHASTHIDGGSDEVAGEQLSASYSPSNYTGGGTILAHLQGIDSALGGGTAPVRYDAYDSVGGVNVTSGAIVTLDNERLSNANVSLSAGVITVNKAGLYLVQGRVTVNVTSGTSRSITECYLRLNSVQVAGTYGLIYNREITEGGGTASFFAFLNLSVGNTLDLYAQRISGSSTISSIADGSCIVLEEKL